MSIKKPSACHRAWGPKVTLSYLQHAQGSLSLAGPRLTIYTYTSPFFRNAWVAERFLNESYKVFRTLFVLRKSYFIQQFVTFVCLNSWNPRVFWIVAWIKYSYFVNLFLKTVWTAFKHLLELQIERAVKFLSSILFSRYFISPVAKAVFPVPAFLLSCFYGLVISFVVPHSSFDIAQ